MQSKETSQAEQILNQAMICDMALGFEPEIESPHKWEVLQSYAAHKLSYVSLHVAMDTTSLERTIQYVAFLTKKIKAHPERYILVKTAKDIECAKSQNKLGIGFVFQGTNPLAKNLDMIDTYKQLGILSMILSYNTRNSVGDGCSEATDAGLSKFGYRVIERMNEVGMLIDCSHTGYKTSMDAMNVSKAPILFSHSNVYAICPHPRNLRDDQIIACAAIGGIIGINGVGALLGDPTSSSHKFIEHICYIIDLVGPQHVALGTDYIYFPELIDDLLKSNPAVYPGDYTQQIKHKASVIWNSLWPKQFIELIELLLKKGYSESIIKDILGNNFIRVAQQVLK